MPLITPNLSVSSISLSSRPSLNFANIASLLDPLSSTPKDYTLWPHELSSIRLYVFVYTILVSTFSFPAFPFVPSHILTLSFFSNFMNVAFVAPSPSICHDFGKIPKKSLLPFSGLSASMTKSSDRARTSLRSCIYNQQETSRIVSI